MSAPIDRIDILQEMSDMAKGFIEGLIPAPPPDPLAVIRTFETGATRDQNSTKPDYSGFLSENAIIKVDEYVLRERDLAFAGGLFEGEGCIGFHQNKPKLELKTTDQDTAIRFNMIVGAGKVYGPYQVKETKDHKRKSPWKPYYHWQARGEDALTVAKLIYPYLGLRRKSTLQQKWGVERLAQVSSLNPVAIKRFGEYMMKHQVQSDGTKRASDNWKKGIPPAAYLESGWRHFIDVWLHLKGLGDLAREDLEDSLCGVIFNIHGLLHETIKTRQEREARIPCCPNSVAAQPTGTAVPPQTIS